MDVSGGRISFSDKSSAGNNVYISSASGTVGDVLGHVGVNEQVGALRSLKLELELAVRSYGPG